MHWLGLDVIRFLIDEIVVQLENMNGEVVEGLVYGSWMKLYREICTYVN
jgi:hypothetical protein